MCVKRETKVVTHVDLILVIWAENDLVRDFRFVSFREKAAEESKF